MTSQRIFGMKISVLNACGLFIATFAILIALTAPLRAQTSEFAYVVNNGSNSVSIYSVDSNTGVLTKVGGSQFPAGSRPESVAVDPSGRFAYVVNYGFNN